MLIAWQTVNAARHPNSKQFSRGFLIVAPGITIKDRLRVLLPNDPESYYRHREIVPPDMLGDIDRAKIVITNYHAFKLRERIAVAKGTRNAIEGWRGDTLQTLETEGQMLQRVMPELMGMKNIVVINDEAHHCYRERVKATTGATEADLKGEDKDEAKANNEAARMWISGLEAVKRQLGLSHVYDLSATPFFLRGSGYAEGTLFPWPRDRSKWRRSRIGRRGGGISRRPSSRASCARRTSRRCSSPMSGATAISIRSSSGAAKTTRTGPT
jgi:type III restriction enzyme